MYSVKSMFFNKIFFLFHLPEAKKDLKGWKKWRNMKVIDVQPKTWKRYDQASVYTRRTKGLTNLNKTVITQGWQILLDAFDGGRQEAQEDEHQIIPGKGDIFYLATKWALRDCTANPTVLISAERN